VRAAAGADLAGVLGEGDIAEVVQRLDPQWLRSRSASRAGLAWAWLRLVIAYTVIARHLLVCRSRVLRVTSKTWAAWNRTDPPDGCRQRAAPTYSGRGAVGCAQGAKRPEREAPSRGSGHCGAERRLDPLEPEPAERGLITRLRPVRSPRR
jgi:hypothetical protein